VHARFGRGRPETYRRNPARRRAPTLPHEKLGAAGATPHAGEAIVQDAAIELRANRLVRAAPPKAVPPLEALLPLVMHVGVVRLDGEFVSPRGGRAGARRGLQGMRPKPRVEGWGLCDAAVSGGAECRALHAVVGMPPPILKRADGAQIF
jgi:hypothetical protein